MGWGIDGFDKLFAKTFRPANDLMTDLFPMWSKLNLMSKLFMAVWMVAGIAWAESGQDLFQKALVAERANGKLDEAIKLYQKIAQRFSSDRGLAANALLQMGR